MRVVGDPADIELAGVDAAPEGDLVVELEETAEAADVRFAEFGAGGGRIIAPAGEGLWRRAPWPVRDALFDLEPPPPGAGALVAGGPPALRDEVAAGLEALGRSVAPDERLTLAALRASAVVVLLADHDALPARAMCVLAARRVLVIGPATVLFGLQPGVELLRASAADEAIQHANTALLHPEATVTLRALGAAAAERHRASRVYERLQTDIALGLA